MFIPSFTQRMGLVAFTFLAGCGASEPPEMRAGETQNALRYGGVYQSGPYYLRFYEDKTLLKTHSRAKSAAQVSWSFDRIRYISTGRYLITGSNIEFSSTSEDGTVDYKGVIQGDSLILNSHSHINDCRRTEVFKFVKVDFPEKRMTEQFRNKLNSRMKTKKQKTKTPGGKVIPVDYLTEIVWYDEFQRPASSVLINTEGKVIAQKDFEFSQHNPTQIRVESTREYTWDSPFHKALRVTNYELGKSKNPMFLVLDEKGSIITRADKPILVKRFRAQQKTKTETEYHGAFMHKRTTKIYPCENCAEKTGIRNSRYVW